MNTVRRTSTLITGIVSLALATGTLSTGALASTPDRADPTFPGDLTGPTDSVGLGTIASDMTPFTVGALNIDTGHVGQRDGGKRSRSSKRSSRSASRQGTA